ncbi:hypothetical protein P20311_3300 [Pseudoalteromonas sp. BSi20311]|uniref:Uncharacterized protein n=1 Tax=Pseudoalteromonas issachenkonii TaxID=152297 RepID=A0ABN5CAU4_9GAMM|nr:hypothetical protein PISS_a3079 [Pseudoalteromonas issachenkonii]GAA65489.1 hypothetical protein P20311_3300 [Pseudoalteromonas sp. BSi20311]
MGPFRGSWLIALISEILLKKNSAVKVPMIVSQNQAKTLKNK